MPLRSAGARRQRPTAARAGARPAARAAGRPAALLALRVALGRLGGGGLGAAADPSCAGGLTVEGLGGDVSGHLSGGPGTIEDGDTLNLSHNSSFSLTSVCEETWSSGGFLPLKLLGTNFSYTVDLGRVGCACKLALYLVEAPARNPAGTPSEGNCTYSPYYCDANQMCGQWCPEIDIMEANSHVFAATPHSCDAPAGKTIHYTNCDRVGIGHNVRDTGSVYGPGATQIDTSFPFEVVTTFHGQPGDGTGTGAAFTGMTTTLRQHDRELVLQNQQSDYLNRISAAMDRGMSLRMKYWGDSARTKSWLKKPPCGERSCAGSTSGAASIGKLQIQSLHGRSPVPPETTLQPLPPVSPSPLSTATRVVQLILDVLLLGFGVTLLVMAAAMERTRWMPEWAQHATLQEAIMQHQRGERDMLAPCRNLAARVAQACARLTQLAASLWANIVSYTPPCPVVPPKFNEDGYDMLLRTGDKVVVQRTLKAQGDSGATTLPVGTRGVVQNIDETGAPILLCENFLRTMRVPPEEILKLAVADEDWNEYPPRQFARPDGDEAGGMSRAPSAAMSPGPSCGATSRSPQARLLRDRSAETLLSATGGKEQGERERLKRLLLVALLVVVVFGLLAVLLRLLERQGPALAPWAVSPAAPAAGGNAAAATQAIPRTGCCSWNSPTTEDRPHGRNDVHDRCGATSDWCNHQAHCEGACLGTWIMPSR